MRVAINSLDFIPWTAFFDLINSVDTFVFYDDVQYLQRDFVNRNRVRVPDKWIWLTVPVKLNKPYYKYKNCDIQISYDFYWPEKISNAIREGYGKSEYYDDLFYMIEKTLKKEHKYLIDLNYELALYICEYLGIKRTKFLFSKELGVPIELKKTDRIIYILDKIGNVNEYISRPGAQDYLEIDKFAKRGITVTWHKYDLPYYRQNLWDSKIFINNLSIIDLIFNHGKDALKIISAEKQIDRHDDVKILSAEEYKDHAKK